MKRGREVKIDDSDEICEIGLEAYSKYRSFAFENNWGKSSNRTYDGEEREKSKALKYIKGSAEAGNGWGMYEYARLFANNLKRKGGLPEIIFFEHNQKERDIWYQKVLQSTHDYAKGLCYANGYGTPKNTETAIWYFNNAYEKQKNLRACAALSDIYHNQTCVNYINNLWAWRWNKRAQYLKNKSRQHSSRYKHFDRHENARRAIWCLLWLIKVPDTILLNFIVPRDIILIICRIIWTTADHHDWETSPTLVQLYVDFKK